MNELLAHGSSCIHRLFEVSAALHSERIAVEGSGRSLTYTELNEKANQLCHHLQSLGVQPGSLVGICMDRFPNVCVALLAVMKAGGAYVPLDPSYPPERLSYILEHSGASLVIADDQTRSRWLDLLTIHPSIRGVPSSGERSESAANLPRIIRLQTGTTQFSEHSGVNPTTASDGSDTAYVMYTSGSTGRPKGVEVAHSSVVNLLRSMYRRLGVTKDDRLLAVITFSFDMSVLELFLPLMVGATVHIAGGSVLADGIKLRDALSSLQVTIMQATPATWRLLLDSGWAGDPGLQILCGGEELQRDLAERLLQHGGSVWNLYGPTETTIYSLAHRVEAGSGLVPIGKALDATQLFILNDELAPVPEGEEGILYIGGEGVAKGYLRNPELTAEKFILSPFEPGKILFRTGDVVRALPEGDLVYLGREDQQVKVRGYRIELGEIELVLALHAGIKQVVVVAQEDSSHEKQVVAYMVPRPDHVPTLFDLLSLVRQKLPEYMVPSSFVFLSEMPQTPNGKVDRKALRKPRGGEADSSYVPPRDSEEIELAKLWAEVLGREQISINQNFFLIGGHSLLAGQLLYKTWYKYGVEISLTEFVINPTVSEMANMVREKSMKFGNQQELEFEKALSEVMAMTPDEIEAELRR